MTNHYRQAYEFVRSLCKNASRWVGACGAAVKLNYALEQVLEVYYRFQLLRHVQTSLDYQYIQNPGYNRDRGPAHVFAGRIRVSF